MTSLTGLSGAKKGLERDKRCADGESWGPLVLEDIEADGSSLRANVRVPDLCDESHLKILIIQNTRVSRKNRNGCGDWAKMAAILPWVA